MKCEVKCITMLLPGDLFSFGASDDLPAHANLHMVIANNERLCTWCLVMCTVLDWTPASTKVRVWST